MITHCISLKATLPYHWLCSHSPKDVPPPPLCVILNQNQLINKGASVMTNSHCDLDLDPIMLKPELVRGIVIPNTCVKLYRNWIINEVARAMTKGEHPNEHTYSHTYVQDRPYIPSTTLLCEGIIIQLLLNQQALKCFAMLL